MVMGGVAWDCATFVLDLPTLELAGSFRKCGYEATDRGSASDSTVCFRHPPSMKLQMSLVHDELMLVVVGMHSRDTCHPMGPWAAIIISIEIVVHAGLSITVPLIKSICTTTSLALTSPWLIAMLLWHYLCYLIEGCMNTSVCIC